MNHNKSIYNFSDLTVSKLNSISGGDWWSDLMNGVKPIQPRSIDIPDYNKVQRY